MPLYDLLSPKVNVELAFESPKNPYRRPPKLRFQTMVAVQGDTDLKGTDNRPTDNRRL